MPFDRSIGYRITASKSTCTEDESPKIIHQKDFLSEDCDAEADARKHHKHIRDLHPDATVVMTPIFENQEDPAEQPALPDT